LNIRLASTVFSIIGYPVAKLNTGNRSCLHFINYIIT
jgi:hypothetical protein